MKEQELGETGAEKKLQWQRDVTEKEDPVAAEMSEKQVGD